MSPRLRENQWFLGRREAGVCDWDGGTSCLSGFFGQQDLNNVGG